MRCAILDCENVHEGGSGTLCAPCQDKPYKKIELRMGDFAKQVILLQHKILELQSLSRKQGE